MVGQSPKSKKCGRDRATSFTTAWVADGAPKMAMPISGLWRFPKSWGYPEIIHFHVIFHHKPSIWGYPHGNPHIRSSRYAGLDDNKEAASLGDYLHSIHMPGNRNRVTVI